MGKPIAAAEVLLLGAAYREDVGDTRYSGSELVVRRLTEMGADIRVHDPYVLHWWELEKQDTYPASGLSWARFFRNQDKLRELQVEKDLFASMKGADAIVLAVRHEQYVNLDPKKVFESVGGPVAVIDCFGILDDDTIWKYFELGCEVKGMGRGHISRMKDAMRKQKGYKL
jgi:UDP-N-acetyl-D-mannosaminuronate dehydrogenase